MYDLLHFVTQNEIRVLFDKYQRCKSSAIVWEKPMKPPWGGRVQEEGLLTKWDGRMDILDIQASRTSRTQVALHKVRQVRKGIQGSISTIPPLESFWTFGAFGAFGVLYLVGVGIWSPG